MGKAVINNKSVSLSDLLRDFNAGRMSKHAEEEAGVMAAPTAVGAPVATSAPTPELCEVCGQSPCVCDDDDEGDEEEYCADGRCDSSDTDDMQDAAAELSERHEEALDAARVLRNMADNYIARHDDAIEKEAAVFGEIFAKSAMRTMGKYASYGDDMPYYYMEKNAAQDLFEQAYMYTMQKLAEGDEAQIAAAQAVSDAAAAAKALVENLGTQNDAQVIAGQAAAQAYEQAMETMGQNQMADNDEEEAAAAAQDAYGEAQSQIQGAADDQAMAAQATPEVANNAYNMAMDQLAQQPQG